MYSRQHRPPTTWTLPKKIIEIMLIELLNMPMKIKNRRSRGTRKIHDTQSMSTRPLRKVDYLPGCAENRICLAEQLRVSRRVACTSRGSGQSVRLPKSNAGPMDPIYVACGPQNGRLRLERPQVGRPSHGNTRSKSFHASFFCLFF